MHFIDMSDYNRAVRIYWWATAALGVVAVGCAMAGVVQLEIGGLLKVIILMAVVFLAGLHPIRVPSTQSFIS
jgi:FtsH-binding integral membrane protein